MISSIARRFFFLCLVSLFAVTSAVAQVNNGGFESGFNFWSTKGDASIQTSTLGINPVAGSNQAFLASATDGTINASVTAGTGLTGSALESTFGLTSGTLAGVGNGTPVLVSAMSQTVKIASGQSLNFSYNFLTNQAYHVTVADTIVPSANNNDFAFLAVIAPNNTQAIFKLADTFSTLNNTGNTVPFMSQTGYHGYSYVASQTGSYLFIIGVAHATNVAQDNGVNSGLLVDNAYVSPTLTNVKVSPTSIQGGATATGTVTLSGAAGGSGIPVSISSNNGAATVPATTTVGAGKTAGSFFIPTSYVASTQTVTIKAILDSTILTTTLTITQAPIANLTLSPTSISGGPSSSTGTVTLSSPAPVGGALVTLGSNNAAATVGANVTVDANSTTKSFPVNTTAVATTQTVTISATYQSFTRNATLTLNPGPITFITVSPTSVQGGTKSTGTVHLLTAAPVGGALVTLSSDNPSVASVPATSTVNAGTTAKSFFVTTTAVATNTPVHISASYGGTTVTTTLTVTP